VVQPVCVGSSAAWTYPLQYVDDHQSAFGVQVEVLIDGGDAAVVEPFRGCSDSELVAGGWVVPDEVI
jgi:hypothetical protein